VVRKSKNAERAERLAAEIGSVVDGACIVHTLGALATLPAGTLGTAAYAAVTGRRGTTGRIEVDRASWLGVGPVEFTLSKCKLNGKPRSEPYARIAYTEVTDIIVTEHILTISAEAWLSDGRTIAFEAGRLGGRKRDVDVLSLLEQRCVR
jgi:hypothetical protein